MKRIERASLIRPIWNLSKQCLYVARTPYSMYAAFGHPINFKFARIILELIMHSVCCAMPCMLAHRCLSYNSVMFSCAASAANVNGFDFWKQRMLCTVVTSSSWRCPDKMYAHHNSVHTSKMKNRKCQLVIIIWIMFDSWYTQTHSK